MSTPLPRPAAVLLDFGGVLTEVYHADDGFGETTIAVAELLEAIGEDGLVLDGIETDLRAGAQAYEVWKRSQSAEPAPRELTHREFWERFICVDWPASARAAVGAHAAPLCEIFESTTVLRPARAGASEFLGDLREMGIPVALVCNTMSGVGTRKLMSRYGFSSLVALELYSDELGLRKPNPALLTWALTALRRDAADVWYVGDKYDRDVLAARRAGVGGAILMTSGDTDPTRRRDQEADAVVADPTELRALLRQHVAG